MKKFKNSNNAVVGIVAAFLIVGLIVAVISVIQTQYVPKWMREKEADHMNELGDQFAQLNYAITTHVYNQRENIPISTTITLGSKEMPYLSSMKAYGKIDILEGDFNVTINGNTSNYSALIGSIKYSSSNNYFINQEYTYECGGVILSQKSGNAMNIKPMFNATWKDFNNITIKFKVINITAMGNKIQSVQGYGPAPIQTEFQMKNKTDTTKNVSFLNITTNYNNSWRNFINSTLIRLGLNWDPSNPNFEIRPPPDGDDGRVVVYFFDNDDIKFDVEIDYYEIGAQIAPGWVEDRN